MEANRKCCERISEDKQLLFGVTIYAYTFLIKKWKKSQNQRKPTIIGGSKIIIQNECIRNKNLAPKTKKKQKTTYIIFQNMRALFGLYCQVQIWVNLRNLIRRRKTNTMYVKQNNMNKHRKEWNNEEYRKP